MKFLFTILLSPLLCFGAIYDCFPFFNELELLEIRLHELNPVVDYFVLVESVETQRGNPKPLYFNENRERFAPFLHKIIHVIIEGKRPYMSMWQRENFQRNAIKRGLKGCKKGDIILISDLDEIPRASLIPHVKEELRRRGLPSINFQMHQYRFHLNRRHPTDYLCFGTVATTYGHLKKYSPQYVRDKRGKMWSFKDAGWHFTWMGGIDRVRQKFNSVVEGDDRETPDEAIESMIQSVPAFPLDESFPQYVLDHAEELRALDFLADMTMTTLTDPIVLYINKEPLLRMEKGELPTGRRWGPLRASGPVGILLP